MELIVILTLAVVGYVATRLLVERAVRAVTQRLGAEGATLVRPLLTPLNALLVLLAVQMTLSFRQRDTAATELLLLAAATWLALRAGKLVLYEWYLPRFHGLALPGALRIFFSALLVVGLLGWALHVWAGMAITDLVAIGALVGLLSGLLLYNFVRDFVQGMTIWLQKAVEVGAHVRIGDYEGDVLGVDWRATRLGVADDAVVSIPNNALMVTPVTTYRGAKGTRRATVVVEVPESVPPNRVASTLLAAAGDVDGVLTEPAPEIRHDGAPGGKNVFRLDVWTETLKDCARAKSQLHSQLWYRLRREGIVKDETVAKPPQQVVLDALRRLPLFGMIEAPLLERLGACLYQRYGLGEVLFRQGDEGPSLFVVMKGRLEVLIDIPSGRTVVADVPAGSFVGERSLLTGERRSATVRAADEAEVLIVTKDDLMQVLRAAPEVAESIGAVMVERDLQRENIALDAAAKAAARITMAIKIRAFFRLQSSSPATGDNPPGARARH